MTPNPNPSPELPNCDLSSCPSCGALPVDWADDPFKAVSDTARVDDAVERMRADPFADDIPLLGTTQQDERMRHYATAALSPQTLPAPGEEWTRTKAFDEAAAECLRAAKESKFADTVSEDERKGYRTACNLMSMSFRVMASRAAPDWPPPAAVAAANDEAFSCGVEAAAKVADDVVLRLIEAMPMGSHSERYVREIAAAIRALATSRSQHEGAE